MKDPAKTSAERILSSLEEYLSRVGFFRWMIEKFNIGKNDRRCRNIKVIYTKFISSYLRTGVKGCSKIRRVFAKLRLILDEMCRLYGKFASYLRSVLHKTRLIFPRINGPIVSTCTVFAKFVFEDIVNKCC